MKTEHYIVTEVFQSATPQARQRNLQRQMEEYILTMLRRELHTPAAPLPASPSVAKKHTSPYNTIE